MATSATAATTTAAISTPAPAMAAPKVYNPAFESHFQKFIQAVNAPLNPPLDAEFTEWLKDCTFSVWGAAVPMGTPNVGNSSAGGSSKKGNRSGRTGYHFFLADYRQSHPDCNLFKDGPAAWKEVPKEQKEAYKAKAAAAKAEAGNSTAGGETSVAASTTAQSGGSKSASPKKSSLNGYHMYMRELKEKAPDHKLAMSSKDLSAAWKKLTEEEHKAYKEKALKYNAEQNGTTAMVAP